MAEEGFVAERPPRVLFVDDEPLVVRSLRRTLTNRKLEWESLFAESGAQALSIADEGGVDVIVSDMHMPGMDGATLLRRVQERHPEIIRIILSGHTDPRLVFRAVPVAHQFLTKPFETTLLINTVERAVQLKRLIVSPALRAVLGGDSRMPVAPRTYTGLTQILAREDASLSQIVELIERDAGLAARIAQLGSSSLFRVPRTVSGLGGIVSYLGVDIIKTLVLTVEIVNVFGSKIVLPGFSIEAFQEHSVRVAHLARKMLDRTEQAEDAFLAGVLHDVGRLVLAARCPDRLALVAAKSKAEGISLLEAETKVLGVTHAEVGAYLLGTWGLPLEIVDAVLFHHRPVSPNAPKVTIGNAVYLANALAHDPDATLEAEPGSEEAPPESSSTSPSSQRLERYRRLAREVRDGGNA